ncbi:MAG: hypothetical protein [Caudoviricetes sp.]|nr:MAG: hypothetical protein [Caudoviricetes sp.]
MTQAKNYPKLTQEVLQDSIYVVMQNLSDKDFLKESPYSALMKNKIVEMGDKVKKDFEKLTEKEPEQKKETLKEEQERLNKLDQEENDSIAAQYGEFGDDLESKNEEYKENYGILIRLEKTIRSMERMTTKGSSDTVKMSAMTKLIDLQQEQVDVLSKIANIQKAQKIESLTRRFFQEIRKTDYLQKIADRYLETLNELD